MTASETPDFIYGTAWKEDDTERLTMLALKSGFRGVDTANQRKHYYESGVGNAIAAAIDQGVVTRDDLFIQTKFTHVAGQDYRLPYDRNAPFGQQVEQSFESSLQHLRVERIDSYLLHGPSTRVGFTKPDREVWGAIEELVRSDRLSRIGVSNVSAEQIETLLELADEAPAFVQNRCFARTRWDHGVRQVCRAHGIVYQGFSLLTANALELGRPEIGRIAQRHGCTIPQLVFRFAQQIGIVPLTGTTSAEHMKQDLQVSRFQLDAEELRTIERIGAR